MDYLSSTDGSVYVEIALGDAVLLIEASDVRRERTGIHGRLCIMLDGEPLAWTIDNIEKDEVRTRLGNKAYSFIDPKWATKVKYSKDDIKHDLDLFCAGLWEQYIKQAEAEEVDGDPDIKLSFLVKPFILEGGGTIIFSPPGRGKSYMGLAMAVCIDAGLDNLWPCRQAKVLFVNLERSAQSVRRRLGMVNRALGLPCNRKLLMVNQRGKSLADIYDGVKSTIAKHDVKVIILDSLSRGGFGDLTGNQDVNRAVDAINSLCPTWLALGHTPRQDESHVFGGIHFDAGADIMIPLTSENKENGTLGVAMEISKANDVSTGQRRTIAFEFDNDALTAIREAESWEFPELEAEHKVSLKEQVEDFLLDMGKASATQIANETGLSRAKISTLLRHDSRFVMVERKGTSVLYGVKTVA